MNDLEQLQEMYKEKADAKAEAAKEILDELASQLYALEKTKDDLEVAHKKVTEKITEVTDKIRDAWGPFISATDKASIDFGPFKLTATTKLNVSADDKDTAIDWFLHNGYKDVLKYDIHHMTMGKIAREHYEKGEEIPGLKYFKLKVIKTV